MRFRPSRLVRFLMPCIAAVLIVSILFMSPGASGEYKINGQSGVAPTPAGAQQNETNVITNFQTEQPDAAFVITSETSDEAVWENGEIISLPNDPDKRRAALELLRTTAAAKGGTPDVTYYPVATGSAEPIHVTMVDGRLPQGGAGYDPTQWDLQNISLGIPDDFELPREVLRKITDESGNIDEAAEAELESILASALIQDFHGIDQTTLTPPDCDIAVGPEHVMVVVNAAYATYDYCGTLLASGNLSDLTDANLFLFDPKVRYDEWNQRWLICFAGRDTGTLEARIRLVVSSGNLPFGVGGHWWYNYDWTNSGGWWGDYPDIGFDGGAIYITTNDFNWSSPPAFQRARITVLDKAEVYNALASGHTDFFNPLNPGDGTQTFALRAAEMHSMPGAYYLVNSKPGGGSFLTWWEITNAPNAPVLNGFNIPVGTYDNPPPMEQGDGTYVACGDARLLSARYFVGRLWTTHGQRINWGEATDRSAIEVYIINSTTRTIAQETGGWGATGFSYFYPAVDMNPNNYGVIPFARGSASEYPGTRYTDLTEGGSFSGSALLAAGLDWYAGGAAGTFADPYRWGDYYGCDLNLDGDQASLWIHGQFASDSPSPSWDTWVGAVNPSGQGAMQVQPVAVPSLVSTGFVGGPFFPPGITYSLTNIGGARLRWDLTNVDAWNTPTTTGGFLNPGRFVNVDVDINATANGFGPGTYSNTYNFEECMRGAVHYRQTSLTVANDGSCPGSIVDLVPDGMPNHGGDDNQDRGVYITALKDFEICTIAIKADLELPQVITANIYEANGTTRGALLATGSITAVTPGEVFHYVPINYVLSECQEYDIAVEWGNANQWPWWNENLLVQPYDVGGVIRVRDGEESGGAGNFALGNFSVIGSSTGPITADLHPGPPPPYYSPDGSTDRGVYVVAEKTLNISSFGWEADLVPPQTLTAVIYESGGLSRGTVIAEGTLEVTTSGLRFHDVPINAVLEEGKEYDLSVQFGTQNAWPYWFETTLTEPYTVEDIRVLDAEYIGDASNVALPHYRVNYGPRVAGEAFDVTTTFLGGTSGGASGGFDFGHFMTAVHDQELYSVGWIADIPEGQVVTVNVFEATGTTRGSLVSSGAILSSGSGMMWHDVPVAVSMVDGQDYDVAIDWTGAPGAQFEFWTDPFQLPWVAYGFVELYGSEFNGVPSASNEFVQMRLSLCSSNPTAIHDGPGAAPRFALSAPYPNPVSTRATIDYSLDQSGPLAITVYDVKGRRVASLLRVESRPVGPGTVEFDGSHLAAGVYFVKMQTQRQSLTRKITILR